MAPPPAKAISLTFAGNLDSLAADVPRSASRRVALLKSISACNSQSELAECKPFGDLVAKLLSKLIARLRLDAWKYQGAKQSKGGLDHGNI